MFGSLFSNKAAPVGPTAPALPQPGSGTSSMSQSEMQSICIGVQQRMQAIQSMHASSFLTFSYVLADNPTQIQQVYNAQFQAGVHYDSGKWHEAKVRNPDSQLAYPLPINGMSALSERSKQQGAHLTNLVAATDTAKTQISNLKAHTDRLILTELSNCERKNDALSIQLSKLCLGIELFGLQNCKASVDFERHRELMEKLERVQQSLGLVQKKIRLAKTSQKLITANPLASSDGSFVSLKSALDARVSAAYSSVLDRCRSIASQRAQDRLKQRASDSLADLKRQYITGGFAFRTMTSAEIEVAKKFASSQDSKSVISSIPLPPVFKDIFAFIATTNLSAVSFLEQKYAAEVIASVGGRQDDKKNVLHAYSRQRTADVWFPLYAAFRAGWSSVLVELSIGNNLPADCAYAASVLARIVERETVNVDLVKLSPNSQKMSPYRDLLVAVCTDQLKGVVIQQLLPECTAFDWVWWGLRGAETMEMLRDKISKLPRNFFATNENQTSTYPSLTDLEYYHPTTHKERDTSTSSLVELCLLNFLVSRFQEGIEICLKPKSEPFNINNPLHRAALWAAISIDKYYVGVISAAYVAELVVEAALPINVVTERNLYLSAVSVETSNIVATLFKNLDRRRPVA